MQRLFKPLFELFDLHLCLVMSACNNPILVYEMVLAPFKADKAIHNIT